MTGVSDPPRGEGPPPSPRERPRVFGDYHLLGVLAEGGMGAIHLARRAGPSPDLQPYCVVKRLHKDLAKQASFLRRFQDEARVVVTLRHPALAHVFDVGAVGDEHYLAMELVEGVSLRELADAAVAADERIEPGVALAIIDDVLDALAWAHERRDAVTGQPLQIVHRDVSPQNIMLTFQGTTKLIDFGVVRSALRAERTVGGVVVGKLGYMSPEQGRGEDVDARTDVYATAVVLWELLSGRRFYGDTPRNRIVFELNEGTWQPSYDDIPDALRAPLRHALQPEAAARTTSAAAFAAELSDAAVAMGLVVASHRVRRALVQRLCGAAEARLAELLRAAHDIRPEPPREATRITTLARSSDGDDVSSSSRPTASLARAKAPSRSASADGGTSPANREVLDEEERLAREPTRILALEATRASTPTSSTGSGRRRAAIAGVVVGFIVVGVILAAALVAVAQRPSGPVLVAAVPVSVDAGRVDPPVVDPAVVDPAVVNPAVVNPAVVNPAVVNPAVVDPAVVNPAVVNPAVVNPAVVAAAMVKPDGKADGGANDEADHGRPPVTTKSSTTTKRARPPGGPLPDLGAQLDYLARWCVGSVACARGVVDARVRIPLLDAAGLTALRDQATKCVAVCRR
jgi:serine/threonine-protein kinase